MAAEDNRIPCTILTGYLGSGKTTLVNHILTDKTHKKKIAIIENEFGDVGIDDALMAKNAKEQVEEEIIEMMNGCICCTVRQDLVVVLKKFADRIKAGTLKNLDCVIIETTGMADPAPVAQTFFVDDEVSKNFRLDGIVTLIDAKHVEQHLDEEKPEGEENEAIEQVAFADRMILNKTDLVTEDDLARVEKRLKSMNSSAPIIRSTRSAVSVDQVLDIRAFDLKKTVEMDPEFLNTENEHEHDTTVSSVSVVEKRPLDLDAIQRWVNYLLVNKGTDLYRMKGVLNIANSDERFMFQAVHMIFNGTFDEPWLADETGRAASCSSARTSTTTSSRRVSKSACSPLSSQRSGSRICDSTLGTPWCATPAPAGSTATSSEGCTATTTCLPEWSPRTRSSSTTEP